MSQFHAMVLLGFIIAGAVIGVFYGWYAGEAAMAVAWLGSLFLNALKMTIIPLIIASVVSGIGSLGDIRQLGKLGGYTMLYYLSTTALAVFIGLLVVNWIQPGAGIQLTQTAVPEHILSKQDTGISDIFLSLISPNLFAAASQTELLPLIVFAILFAMALTTIGDRSKPVFAVFDGINEAMMKLVIWIMHFAPIGIFALIAARLGSTGGGRTVYGRNQRSRHACCDGTDRSAASRNYIILYSLFCRPPRYGLPVRYGQGTGHGLWYRQFLSHPAADHGVCS